MKLGQRFLCFLHSNAEKGSQREGNRRESGTLGNVGNRVKRGHELVEAIVTVGAIWKVN